MVEKPSTVGTISTRPPFARTSSWPTTVLDGVVAALDENIGTKDADELEWGVFFEQHDGVDGGEGGHDAGAFALTDDGPGGPFEAADGAVGVEAEDEFRAETAAVLEQGDVADVEEIEAAVGEDDGFAGGAPLGDTFALCGRDRGSFRSAVTPELGVSSATSSCAAIGTVPTLPTTIPAARLASSTEVRTVRPAAMPAARVAITVSPAPETSKTSRARAGSRSMLPGMSPMAGRRMAIPFSLMVTVRNSRPCSRRELLAGGEEVGRSGG